jgi:hypothetical protein
MKFSSAEKVRAIRALTEALFRHVLYDEEPIFVGDEATLLDVSLTPPEELLRRCLEYYKTRVSMADLRRPLWELLPELERRREAAR